MIEILLQGSIHEEAELEKEIAEVLPLEYCYIRIGYVDAVEGREELSEEFEDVVLEKNENIK